MSAHLEHKHKKMAGDGAELLDFDTHFSDGVTVGQLCRLLLLVSREKPDLRSALPVPGLVRCVCEYIGADLNTECPAYGMIVARGWRRAPGERARAFFEQCGVACVVVKPRQEQWTSVRVQGRWIDLPARGERPALVMYPSPNWNKPTCVSSSDVWRRVKAEGKDDFYRHLGVTKQAPRSSKDHYCLVMVTTDVVLRGVWHRHCPFHPVKFHGHAQETGMDLDRVSNTKQTRHLQHCYIVAAPPQPSASTA